MKDQPAGYFLVDSVEDGVKLVKDSTNNAVMAGRETLFFDIQRFGEKTLTEHLDSLINFPLVLQVPVTFIWARN